MYEQRIRKRVEACGDYTLLDVGLEPPDVVRSLVAIVSDGERVIRIPLPDNLMVSASPENVAIYILESLSLMD